MRVRFRFHPIRVPIGVAFIALSAGIRSYGETILHPSVAITFGALVFVGGVAVLISGIVQIYAKKEVILRSIWDTTEVQQAIASAPIGSTTRILQTWLPDYEMFVPFLRELLILKDYCLNLEVLLMNPGGETDADDLVNARVKLRDEEREEAHQKIIATTKRFIALKQEVDNAWVNRHDRGPLQLEIRYYDFMPHGPIFQIENEVMFVGFYLNYTSSNNGPMLVIRDSTLPMWKMFEEEWKRGWDSGKPAFKS